MEKVILIAVIAGGVAFVTEKAVQGVKWTGHKVKRGAIALVHVLHPTKK